MGQRKEQVAGTEVQGTDHRQGLFRRRRCSLPPGQSQFSESGDQRKLPSRIPLHPQQAAWDLSPVKAPPSALNVMARIVILTSLGPHPDERECGS